MHFPKIASTNAAAVKLLANMRPSHGTVVTADNQTIGRGQIGRFWTSEPASNVAMSVILLPGLPVAHQFVLSAVAAFAVQAVVERFVSGQVAIKWPNDVYTEDRKIAGILIQNTLAGQMIRNSVIGIGINVNQVKWPESVPNPVSLRMLAGTQIDPGEVMNFLLQHLNSEWDNAQSQSIERIVERYEQHMFRKHQQSLFRELESGHTIKGSIDGVDQSGRLRLLVDNTPRYYALHEIRQVIG